MTERKRTKGGERNREDINRWIRLTREGGKILINVEDRRK